MDKQAERDLFQGTREVLCRRECCGCGKHMGWKMCCVPPGYPRVTHGICTPCAEAMRERRDESAGVEVTA